MLGTHRLCGLERNRGHQCGGCPFLTNMAAERLCLAMCYLRAGAIYRADIAFALGGPGGRYRSSFGKGERQPPCANGRGNDSGAAPPAPRLIFLKRKLGNFRPAKADRPKSLLVSSTSPRRGDRKKKLSNRPARTSCPDLFYARARHS